MTIIELAWSASIHWLTSDCHVSINVDFIYAMLVDEKEVRLTTARETLEKEFVAAKRKYMKACKEERDYLREKKRQRDQDKDRMKSVTDRPSVPRPGSESNIVALLSWA